MVETEDIAQEVLLDTAKSVVSATERGEMSFWRWLGVATENRIRMAARLARRKPLVPTSTLPPPDVFVRDAAPARPEDPDGLRDRLERLLPLMSEDHRIVLQLRHFDGLSFLAISRRMGRSENAIWMLHKRAQVDLAERMLATRE